MASLIRFNKPTLLRRDMDAVLQTMVDEKIGPGEKKREFVKNFSLYIGCKDGIALRTYPDAIRFSLKALGFSSGDKIAISVFSPEIVYSVLSDYGLDVIIVDSSKTSPIDEERLAGLKDEGLKGIYLFEPYGFLPEDSEAFSNLSLPIIEDISESLGSYYEEGPNAGSFGSVVVTSFEERSLVSTAGGSGVFSRKDEIVSKLKEESRKSGKYTDMPDLNAALGNIQLIKLDETLAIRREMVKAYQASLMQGEAKPFLPKTSSFVANGYAFPLIVEGKSEDAIDFAKKNGVAVEKSFTEAVGYRYRENYNLYPNANAALSRSLSFPLYPMLRRQELDIIEKVIRHIGG